MIVLDASAVLALVHDEPGADEVAAVLSHASLLSVNLAEVVGKLVDVGVDTGRLQHLLVAAGVEVAPFTATDAQLAGALRSISGGRSLSLGDRCCLAFALRVDHARVLTADRAWADLELPLRIELVR